MNNSGTPTRFQSYTRPPPPELQTFAKTFMKGISRPTPEQAQTLQRALSQEDPLADAWIAYAQQQLTRGEASRRMSAIR